jgi:hypothetical protein
MYSASQRGAPGHQEEVVCEEHEIFMTWRLTSYGLSWTRHRSYGKILPSLGVFPIIERFSKDVRRLIRTGDLRDFQRFLSW